MAQPVPEILDLLPGSVVSLIRLYNDLKLVIPAKAGISYG